MKKLSHTQEIKYFDVACDMCGRKAVDTVREFGENATWEIDNYEGSYATYTRCFLRNSGGSDEDDIGVKLECGEEYECYVCPKCFKDKLIPFLESQKIKPTK